MSKIKILLVDDHPMVRMGLKQLLATQGDLEVVGEAADGREALEVAREASPDVVLLDLSMPGMSGFEAIKILRDIVPSAGVIVFSMLEKEEYVHQLLSAGARGYLLKGSDANEILQAIRRVHAGEFFLGKKINAEVIDLYLRCRHGKAPAEPYDQLSEREQQVFRLLVEGKSTTRIAELLFISPKTVEKHRVNVMKKLEVDDLISMAKYALRIGIIDPDTWKY